MLVIIWSIGVINHVLRILTIPHVRSNFELKNKPPPRSSAPSSFPPPLHNIETLPENASMPNAQQANRQAWDYAVQYILRSILLRSTCEM